MANSQPGFVLVSGTFLLPAVWIMVTGRSKLEKVIAAYLQHIAAHLGMIPRRSRVHFKFREQTLPRNSEARLYSLGIQGIDHWSSGPTTTCTITTVVVPEHGPLGHQAPSRTRGRKPIGER